MVMELLREVLMFLRGIGILPLGLGFGFHRTSLVTFSDKTGCLGYYPLSMIQGCGGLRYKGHIDTTIQF